MTVRRFLPLPRTGRGHAPTYSLHESHLVIFPRRGLARTGGGAFGAIKTNAAGTCDTGSARIGALMALLVAEGLHPIKHLDAQNT